MLPDLTIAMTTLNTGPDRLRRISKCISSWHHRLIYDGYLHLFVGDDGSKLPPTPYWERGSVTLSQRFKEGVGSSLNRGFKWAFNQSDFALYFVDDWALEVSLDLTPWVELLQENEDIGMVRLGPPHPNLKGQIQMFKQGWGLRLERYGFAFGHRPALYHKRMIDAYGMFDENCSALECERLYNERFVHQPGPSILYALPNVFSHDDTLPSLSGVEPCI